MKKIISNPEYDKAKIDLGWLVKGAIGQGSSGAKFKTKPPSAAYASQALLNEWIAKNAIYPTIEVE